MKVKKLNIKSINKQFVSCIIICCFILFVTNIIVAQSNFVNPFQSVKGEKEFLYGIDNRRTHIQKQSTLIYGLYTGIGLGGSLRFKIGVSGTPFEVGKSTDEFGNIQRNRFYFLNIGEEFDFYIKNRFRITAYLQGGFGYNDYRKVDENDETISLGRANIIPLEFGTHANYDVLTWLRAKAGGGWRIVLPNEVSYLSGYYIKLAFSMSTSRFIKSCKKWKSEREEG